MSGRQMTEYQMSLLADIFRIIVKEIRSDEDKEKLAPGEMGISYIEGTFYIRNPHTGELFSPNSVEHIKQILNNYNPITHELNADRVNHIRFYTSMSQLTQIGNSLDADTAIRQMTVPSIMYTPVEYENYENMQFPSSKGLFAVIKLNEEFVQCTFSDLVSNVEYDGIYNSEKHLFQGWVPRGTRNEQEMGESTSGGTTININYGKPYYDMTVITIRVNFDILPGAKISIDGKTALPLVYADGTPLDTTIPANTIIMLVYDDKRKVWVYCNPLTDDVQSIINQILASRLNNVAITPAISSYLYTVAQEGVSTIVVTGFNKNTDILYVNYGQTMLRQGIDYVFTDTSDNTIMIANGIQFAVGDQLFFQIVKFNATITS